MKPAQILQGVSDRLLLFHRVAIVMTCQLFDTLLKGCMGSLDSLLQLGGVEFECLRLAQSLHEVSCVIRKVILLSPSASILLRAFPKTLQTSLKSFGGG